MSDEKRATAAEIVHELNNALAAIQGNVDLVRGEPGDAAGLRESLDEIDKAVVRARDIAQRLLRGEGRPSPSERGSRSPFVPEMNRGRRGITVLVADDEEPVRRVASRLLKRDGYDVREAVNGAEALRILSAAGESIDLVISDVMMPEMGGLELARRVSAEWPGLPILLISGFTDDAEIRQSLPAGLVLLQKPFSGSELLGAVGTALRERKS